LIGETLTPDNATGCGEPAALSTMLILARLFPADTGLNETDSEQLAFTASDAPQVFPKTKSSACPSRRRYCTPTSTISLCL
jgi:hypothetical protein